METDQEDFITYLSTLDPALQHIITAEETGAIITNTANKFGLDIQKRDLLSDEVMFTLMGIDNLNNFKNNIVVNLGIGDKEATQITEIINKELFDLVKEELSSLYSEGDLKKETSSNVETSSDLDLTNTPVYRPEGFGQARNTNEDVRLTVKTSNINYQSGVSLKDTLLGTNPKDSSFAKKLEALGKEGGGDIKKEDPYREAPTP